jgi:hypothetical protein
VKRYYTKMKIRSIVLSSIIIGSASAFAPAPSRAFVSTRLFAEEETETEAPAGALVPIKEETIEFTAGLIGGALGFAIGGPVLGAIGAAAANYASKTDQEVGEVTQTISKSAIEIYNYLATLDAKYELLNKAKASLESALEKVKSADNVDPETVKKVEAALESTSAKIKEINEEYDLVGAGNTALGVIGDLVERAIKQAATINEEYNLTQKASDALKGAVSKAKAATDK